jgi:hypothetical protein
MTNKPATTLDEHVALIATRSEWSNLACIIAKTPEGRSFLASHSEFIPPATTCFPTPNIFEAIFLVDSETSSRIDTHATICNRVRIHRSNTTRRSAWEVE